MYFNFSLDISEHDAMDRYIATNISIGLDDPVVIGDLQFTLEAAWTDDERLIDQACFLYTGRDFYAFDISEKLSFCIFGTEFFEN